MTLYLRILIIAISLSSFNFAYAEIDDVWTKAINVTNNNSQWFPYHISVEELIYNENEKIEVKSITNLAYDKILNLKPVKALTNGEPVIFDNEDIKELIKDEIDFLKDSILTNHYNYQIESEQLVGEVECNNEKYNHYRLSVKYASVLLTVNIYIRQSDGVLLHYQINSNGFDEEDTKILSFLQKVYFNGDKDNWYPIYKYEETVFEVPIMIFNKWRGTSVINTKYTDYFKQKNNAK